MAKFWRSNQFRQLNNEWSEILKNTGFQDAEKEIAGERVLKQSSDYAYRRSETVEVVRENKLTYFSLLSEHIAKNPRFDDDSDCLIMTLTAEGHTIREISDELQLKGMRKHNRDTIRYVRRRYEDKWGIKTWTAMEMVSRRVPTRS